MAKSTDKSYGEDLADQLFHALAAMEFVPLEGVRDLPVIKGVTRGAGFIGLQENVLMHLIGVLQESARVYLYGDQVVFETDRIDGAGRRLVTLRSGNVVEPAAEYQLANVLVCEHQRKQFPPPAWLVQTLLAAETLSPRLPRINAYAQRPLFDSNFVLRGPGWHADAGILIHGPVIEPTIFMPPTATASAMSRLPIHLQTLLGGFCFRTDSDVANVVALLITGLLVNHFVATGKPIGLFDGNQPGTGKTLLVRVLGLVLDGMEPAMLFYTPDDEELQKRMCAKLRERPSSVLLIDNAKMVGGAAISSPVIESLSVSPEVSIRILGVSATYTRPNDLLWTLTMNDTRTSPDLVSRGLPIQLFYEGRVEDRVFCGPDPIAYASQHRLDILGELAGMVVRWAQMGRPDGSRSHRLQHWARTVGGIMEVAGLPEFLDNAQEAAAAFNSASDELAALAEAVVADAGPFMIDGEDSEEST